MPEIKIHDGDSLYSFRIEKDELLLDALRERGFSIYSPCGGKGSCGKCQVMVKGTGMVTSCLFKVQDSIEVVLPEQRGRRFSVRNIRLPVICH